jgi:hypothetical protein
MTAAIQCLDRQCWQDLARTFDDYNYRQIWEFGQACAHRLAASSEHVALRQGTQILGLADVRIKRLPLLRTGIAYITGAPMVRQSGQSDPQRLRTCLHALLDEYVNRRRLVLRILAAPGTPDWNAAQQQVFLDLGFLAAQHVPGYRTLLLDINRPEADIRKTLAQKWRNGLNRAERNNLTIRSGTSMELFDRFCDLYRRLLDRKPFHVDLHADFYARVQQCLAEPEAFIVSLADNAGHTVAGHVASILGDTCVYLLGASGQQALQDKSSYLLQWHTIQTARQHGCRWYDLGGIDPEANPGVYHFKQGLGGTDTTAAGPFERQPVGIRRHIVRGCERMYHSARRLMRTAR